jgi:protein TonB
MAGAIRARSQGYRSAPPRWGSAAAVLLLHFLLALLVLSQRPAALERPAERVETIPLSIPPLEAPREEFTVALAPPEEPSRERPARPLPPAPEPRSAGAREERLSPAAPAPLPGSPAPTATPTGTTAAPSGTGTGAGSGAGSGTGGGSGAGSGGVDGGGGGGAAGREPEIAPARWAGAMLWERLNGYHPPGALRRGVAGWATLVCRVRLDRTVHSCGVEQESDPAEGFGRAAVRASREFRIHPRQVDGVEIDNGRVRTTVRFTLPPKVRRN